MEFFGPGVSTLSIADRATISNMCPEYGATVGFFPVDKQSLFYLRQTGMHLVFLPFPVLLSPLLLFLHCDFLGEKKTDFTPWPKGEGKWVRALG